MGGKLTRATQGAPSGLQFRKKPLWSNRDGTASGSLGIHYRGNMKPHSVFFVPTPHQEGVKAQPPHRWYAEAAYTHPPSREAKLNLQWKIQLPALPEEAWKLKLSLKPRIPNSAQEGRETEPY